MVSSNSHIFVQSDVSVCNFLKDTFQLKDNFWLSREELSSKPATALTALFASLALRIERVPRAIRKARELQED